MEQEESSLMQDESVNVKVATKQTLSSAVSSKAATAVKAEIKRLVTQDATNPTNWRHYVTGEWCAR